ncbi:hypothetical protein E9993_06475 [Labilibacter sediminis]|nr:hypothetical protein E9993_06475 [Labilibacter sediminis]
MYIYRFVFFLLLLFSAALNAQNSLNLYDKTVKEIAHLEDEREQEYQLAEFSKSFMKHLESYTSFTSIEDTSHIKMTRSSDSKYTVFYYNSYKNGVVYRLDWYILSGEVNQKKVIHFYDKNISAKVKKGNGELQLHLSRQTNGEIDLYPLTVSFKADMKIYKEYRDVASISLFEEILSYKTAEERIAINDSIKNRLNLLWSNPELFEDKFEGLKRVSTLISEDKKVKICTWNIELPDATNVFFGAVIVKNKGGEVEVSLLKDNTKGVRSPKKSMLSPKKWYGAIYYDIISVKEKTSTYYMLLGYKPNNEMTRMKVVDAMVLLNNTQPRFGKSVFQSDRIVDKRLVFEYAASTNMMLRYDRVSETIVMDHLAPPNNTYKGNYRFYGPDFSYDAYIYTKGKWVLNKDVDLRNPKEEL